MKLKSYLVAGACVTALTLFTQAAAFAAPKEKAAADAEATASPSPDAEASPAAKRARPARFRGKVSAVDTSASTFTIGGKKQRVIKVTEKTKVSKDGAGAAIGDITADESVSGSYWKQDDGTLEAKKVNIGAKGGSRKKSKKSDAESDAAAQSEASPSPSESPAKKK